MKDKETLNHGILTLMHIKGFIHELLEKFGYSDYVILHYLEKNGSSDYKTLSAKLKITPSAISQRVRFLLETKIIENCKDQSDKPDKRSKHVRLTSRGINLLTELRTKFSKYEYLLDVTIIDKFKKYLIVSLGAINRIEELQSEE